jgi:hypothetical protein
LANLTVESHYRTTISTQIVALYKLPILDCLLWSGTKVSTNNSEYVTSLF